MLLSKLNFLPVVKCFRITYKLHILCNITKVEQILQILIFLFDKFISPDGYDHIFILEVIHLFVVYLTSTLNHRINSHIVGCEVSNLVSFWDHLVDDTEFIFRNYRITNPVMIWFEKIV